MKSAHVIALALLSLLFTPGSPLVAQVPEKFENLKILPKDISQKQLLEIMRSFTSGLGVRCPYCHVGEEGKPLSTFNFASDEKEQKQIARLMLKMTQEINTKFLAELKEGSEIVTVKCATCHHGLSKPDSIEDSLLAAMKKGGIKSASEKYKELWKIYHGSDAYNFQPAPLNRLARRFLAEKKNLEAIEILQLNSETHPESAEVQLLLADAYIAIEDKEKALQALNKALKLDPENQEAKNKIQEFQKIE